MKNIKKAFTMIELVFVIVVLGILSAVAIPKLSAYVEDANIAAGISTVSSIRTAIASERQKSLILGVIGYPQLLDTGTTGDHQKLFDGNATIDILQYPIYSGTDSGDWKKLTDNSGLTINYKYYIGSAKTVIFKYTKLTGVFDCDHTEDNCRQLAE